MNECGPGCPCGLHSNRYRDTKPARCCPAYPRCEHALVELSQEQARGPEKCGTLYWGRPPKWSAARRVRVCACTRPPGHEGECRGKPLSKAERQALEQKLDGEQLRHVAAAR